MKPRWIPPGEVAEGTEYTTAPLRLEAKKGTHPLVVICLMRGPKLEKMACVASDRWNAMSAAERRAWFMESFPEMYSGRN